MSPSSPTATIRAGNSVRASCSARSGPMPAGSPVVSAITGSLEPIFALQSLGKGCGGTALRFPCSDPLPVLQAKRHVSPVAQLPQPVLVCLVVASLPQGLSSLQPAALGAHVGDAAIHHLDQVKAERRFHR